MNGYGRLPAFFSTLRGFFVFLFLLSCRCSLCQHSRANPPNHYTISNKLIASGTSFLICYSLSKFFVVVVVVVVLVVLVVVIIIIVFFSPSFFVIFGAPSSVARGESVKEWSTAHASDGIIK